MAIIATQSPVIDNPGYSPFSVPVALAGIEEGALIWATYSGAGVRTLALEKSEGAALYGLCIAVHGASNSGECLLRGEVDGGLLPAPLTDQQIDTLAAHGIFVR